MSRPGGLKILGLWVRDCVPTSSDAVREDQEVEEVEEVDDDEEKVAGNTHRASSGKVQK
jgi:hypothetical protein